MNVNSAVFVPQAQVHVKPQPHQLLQPQQQQQSTRVIHTNMTHWQNYVVPTSVPVFVQMANYYQYYRVQQQQQQQQQLHLQQHILRAQQLQRQKYHYHLHLQAQVQAQQQQLQQQQQLKFVHPPVIVSLYTPQQQQQQQAQYMAIANETAAPLDAQPKATTADAAEPIASADKMPDEATAEPPQLAAPTKQQQVVDPKATRAGSTEANAGAAMLPKATALDGPTKPQTPKAAAVGAAENRALNAKENSTTTAKGASQTLASVSTKSNDTMQRNNGSSKISGHATTTLKQHSQNFYQNTTTMLQQQQQQQIALNKNDSSDSCISTSSRQYHQQQQQQQQTNGKQRKSRGHGKRHETTNTNGAQQHPQQQQQQLQQPQKRTSIFSVDEWLGRNMLFCYERRFGSSCSEDNLNAATTTTTVTVTASATTTTTVTPRHNPAHRNSTSSEAAASEDFNSSSSNEDIALKMSKHKATAAKSRQKRQQKRQKQQQQTQQSNNNSGNNNNSNGNNNDDEAGKENRRNSNSYNNNNNSNYGKQHNSQQQQQQYNKTNNNLRKQCTKAAAMRAQNNNSSNNNKQTTTHNAQQQQPHGVNKTHNNNAPATNANTNGSISASSSTSSLNSAGKAQLSKGKHTHSNNNASDGGHSSATSLYAATSSTSLSSAVSSTSSSPSGSPKNSPTASPTAYKRNTPYHKRTHHQRPPSRCVLDNVTVNEHEFIEHLRRFIIDPNLLRIYGYPVESAVHEGCIEIFKCLPKHLMQANAQQPHTNAHRQQNVINSNDGLYVKSSQQAATDSGRGSGDSSPPSLDSDSSEAGEDDSNGTTVFYTPDGSYQIFSQYDHSLEKQCVRCKSAFLVTDEGEYITRDACFYHWGKLNPVYAGESVQTWQYSCCQGEEHALGCCSHSLHVWTGAAVGLNGPYTDFVYTQPAPDAGDMERPQKLYALDCEMSFTGRGLEVTKVTLVAYDGSMVYETFVRPQAEIVDYNTRFSGITEEDLCVNSNSGVKTLEEVQHDLLQIIDADTVLLGHGLDNDLRVLRIVHKTVVDTSIAFPHACGFPFRRALRHLMKVLLNRDVQTGDKGHSSFEDSRACLELMLWKLRRELNIEFFE